ncbi:hypothetical protein ACFV0Z_12730 [Streptomyces xiamenensis]|uniref:hypothetical protein n=1 Tax=Streptomyces xiamenensis TaxID=408015 RepID=UPI0036A4AB08
MRSFIGTHEVLDSNDFAELVLGTDPDLWLGVEDETSEERAARMDAALDILADDPTLITHVAVVTISALEEHVRQLAARWGRTTAVAECDAADRIPTLRQAGGAR